MATDSLFQRFLASDSPEVFHEIFAIDEPKVRGWCARRLRRPEDVDDATQEVFTILLTRRRTLKPDNLAGYLKETARRVTSKIIRKQFRLAQIRAHLAAHLTDAGVADAIRSEPTDRGEAAEAMLRILATLPPRDQELIRLRFIENVPIKQISAALHVSVRALQMRKRRAIARLRRMLAEKPGRPPPKPRRR